MKKLALFIATIISPLMLVATPAYAQFEEVCKNPDAASSQICQDNKDEIVGSKGIITRIIEVISVVGGILAVIMIIVGGLMYILARGDAGRVKIAREAIVYALIGLVVIALANAIVALLISTT